MQYYTILWCNTLYYEIATPAAHVGGASVVPSRAGLSPIIIIITIILSSSSSSSSMIIISSSTTIIMLIMCAICSITIVMIIINMFE